MKTSSGFYTRIMGIISLALIMGLQAQAQDGHPPLADNNAIRLNHVYGELAGTGIIMSVNYERLIRLGPRAPLIGLRVGVLPIFVISPVLEVNVLFKGPIHFIEAGVGTNFGAISEEGESKLWPSARVGYRYQGKKGLLFRAGLMVIENFDEDGIMPYGGLSLGYSF